MLVKDDHLNSGCFLVINNYYSNENLQSYCIPYGTNEYFGHGTVVSIDNMDDAVAYFCDIEEDLLMKDIVYLTIDDALKNGFTEYIL